MLRTCPCCSCHYRVEDGACPHCGSACAAKRRSKAALLLGLSLSAGGCISQEMYGIAKVDDSADVVDEDGDGWLSDDDCDDDNPDIHPEATETPGDGVDSNCDGEDDT